MRGRFFAGILLFWAQAASAQGVGLFDRHSDVGAVSPPGTAGQEATNGDYSVTAAGANVWARVDALHYLWKKMSGDVVLTANVTFPPAAYSHPPAEHRKGMLMIRQSLDPGSQQVSIHVHGVGMTALQHRDRRGDNTQSIEINIDALPKTVRLEKHGDTFTMFLSRAGGTDRFASQAAKTLDFTGREGAGADRAARWRPAPRLAPCRAQSGARRSCHAAAASTASASTQSGHSPSLATQLA